MNSVERAERRRYPRVKREIPLRIKQDDYDFVGQTRDISCIGAYCTINKHIPLFSIISVILLLPLNKGRKDGGTSIRCKGVVVRIDNNPQNSKEYNIAIYFNRLREFDKAKLLEYVQRCL